MGDKGLELLRHATRPGKLRFPRAPAQVHEGGRPVQPGTRPRLANVSPLQRPYSVEPILGSGDIDPLNESSTVECRGPALEGVAMSTQDGPALGASLAEMRAAPATRLPAALRKTGHDPPRKSLFFTFAKEREEDASLHKSPPRLRPLSRAALLLMRGNMS